MYLECLLCSQVVKQLETHEKHLKEIHDVDIYSDDDLTWYLYIEDYGLDILKKTRDETYSQNKMPTQLISIITNTIESSNRGEVTSVDNLDLPENQISNQELSNFDDIMSEEHTDENMK